jgi:hypothetical protein
MAGSQLWSWCLAAVGIGALLLAATRPRAGWTLAIAVQALWVTYAVVTRQWGFIASAGAYAIAYARLLRRARPSVPSTKEPTDHA